jgi:hypothetical protein
LTALQIWAMPPIFDLVVTQVQIGDTRRVLRDHLAKLDAMVVGEALVGEVDVANHGL